MDWNIDPKQHVEIPADKVREACAAAYALSRPVGLGLLHAREGDLDDEMLDQIIAHGERRGGPSMDYVHGRQCKFNLYKVGDRFFAQPEWYDHSRSQFVDLLTRIGVADAEEKIAAAIAARDD